MDLATGAMGTLLPKLLELLGEEYKLQKGVREGVKSLEKEMRSMHAALCKVSEVPRDQLDLQVKIWAGEVRELSFDMEDVVDKFLVRVDDGSEHAAKSDKLKRLTKKMAGLFTREKARHEIADAIEVMNKQVKEIADRRERYNIDNIVGRPAAVTLDPLLRALYTEVTELVGIDGKRDQELMKLVSNEDDVSEKKLKIVSVVGFGGLGKTTLVKTVYDKIKGDFNCCAFVSVGRNADPKKILMDILLDLGMEGSQLSMMDETRLVNKLRESLEKKRYLIVIDDIWDEKLWTTINWAFSKANGYGSRLITTTRIVSASKLCCSSTNDSVYQMEPLSGDDSRRLFHKRIFSQESGCPHEFEKVSEDILKKCGGVPLAIITIASVLASDERANSLNEWHVLLESIGRGLTDDPGVEEMMRILSFSYYDIASHLKTCLLYLSMFPEDRAIMKDQLIWMWIAESFVQCGKAKTSLFEVGETYFNELVNRRLIQPVYDEQKALVNRRLFHKRIFSQESGCPHEFEKVSEDILKKCGGVPLAIITIASVLASDQKVNSLDEWHVLLESIGRGLTEDPSVDEMMRILSFSYYDLASHLKTCLLYLSMFPEDREIMKDQLIWMWIAESFVQCGKAKTNLFEVGETYFNELVNKSLIQPVYTGHGFVYACRVHDSVLDLICSLSSEEKIVTIVNGTSDNISSEGIVRRLSLQNARKEEGETRPLRSESIEQVRSVVTFAPAIDLMPPFSSFVVLHVLHLDGYDGTKEDHLNLQELGSLLHLRYLRLSGEAVNDLPEDIGKLQFLLVLDLPRGTRLPSTVIKPTRLMCLRTNGGNFQLPDGVENLRSVEVLNKIKVGSASIVKELGNMHRLRELNIQFESSEPVEAFVESLGKMPKIQRVEISAKCERAVSMDLLGQLWVPFACLQKFIMHKGVRLSMLPTWNPYHLPQLSCLAIRVGDVRQEDLTFLGRLPALRILWVWSDNQRPLLVGAEGFRCLEIVFLRSKSPSQILFQPGAMPKAEHIFLEIDLRAAKEEATGNSGDWFDMGIGTCRPFGLSMLNSTVLE